MGGISSQPQVATVEQEVAEALARLIEAEILGVDDLKKGHELTDVVYDKTACCQGEALLYFVLGNSVGLSVQGLGVRFVANGHKPGGDSHDANLVRLPDGSTIMVDVTRGLGRGVLVSRAFRFDDAYRRVGEYWELKDESNPLGLHRRVRPMDAAALTAQLYFVRGNDCLEKGEYDKAIGDCAQAIRLDPKDAGAYRGRGVAYGHNGEYEKAIADCSEAIRLDPRFAGAYYARAVTYGQKGDYSKAIADYTEAIRLVPKFAYAYYGRGYAYEKKGEKAKADEDFAKAEKLGYVQQRVLPGLDMPEIREFFYLLEDERSVPRPRRQGPPLTPDEPEKNK